MFSVFVLFNKVSYELAPQVSYFKTNGYAADNRYVSISCIGVLSSLKLTLTSFSSKRTVWAMQGLCLFQWHANAIHVFLLKRNVNVLSLGQFVISWLRNNSIFSKLSLSPPRDTYLSTFLFKKRHLENTYSLCFGYSYFRLHEFTRVSRRQLCSMGQGWTV